MDSDATGNFVRAIELATGILAVATVVILSSVAGASAFLAFQPSSLQAQALSAADAAVNSTTSIACQQEIKTAAARGTPDTESIVTNRTSVQFADSCIAAVLNPGASSLRLANPASYKCVGKDTKVTVGVGDLVSEMAVPNTAIPPGTCVTVACRAPGTTGQSSCIAAGNLTSVSGTTIQAALSDAPNAITLDPGITSLSMNADGSVVTASGSASSILDSSAGVRSIAGNVANGYQGAPGTLSFPGPALVDPSSIGEAQAVAAQPTETPQDRAVTRKPVYSGATSAAALQQSSVSSPSAIALPSAQTSASQAAGASINSAPVSSQSSLAIPNTTGQQPITPSLDGSAQLGQLENGTVPAPQIQNLSPVANTGSSPSLIERVGNALSSYSMTLVNDVRSFF